MSIVVDARVLLKSPTTVDDACDTKPPPNVPRPVKVEAPVTPSVEESVVAPVTPKVPAKEPVPPTNVPIVALFEKRSVEVAVPKYPVPLAVNAVDDAYGKVDAAVVDVAVKRGAVIVSYAVRRFLKSASPFTSRMLPVVEVDDWPMRTT